MEPGRRSNRELENDHIMWLLDSISERHYGLVCVSNIGLDEKKKKQEEEGEKDGEGKRRLLLRRRWTAL